MIIVLDTNCLIQILPRQAKHRWLFDALLDGEIHLAIISEILNEYEETINFFYESDTLGGNVAGLLLNLPNTRRIKVHYHWRLITQDPDDDNYVDCAVAANADYIITHDGHFKVLKQVGFPKIICLSLEEFKKIWSQSK